MTKSKKSLKIKLKELFIKYPPLKPVLAALCIILLLFLVHIAIKIFNGGAMYYSITFGILLGLMCGYLLQSRLSQGFRIGTLGIFSGMGLDLFANSFNDGSQKTITAINSVGTFISGQYANVVPGSPPLEMVEKNVNLGLWVAILVIVLVLICAKIFSPKAEVES